MSAFPKLSNRGQALALAAWCGLLYFAASALPCLESVCSQGDLWLMGVLGGGLLIPCYFGSIFLGTIFFPSLIVEQ